jgi:hypothetical protein
MSCLHCGRLEASAGRGLCWKCHKTPAVRACYPRLSRSVKGPADDNHEPPPPDRATDAPSGSEAKVAVLVERVACGVGLWHPDDGIADGSE